MIASVIRRIALRTILGAALVALAGCATYVPATESHSVAYHRAWNAALSAMRDESVRVSKEDKAAGIIEGTNGRVTVQASVKGQPDGSARVEFTRTGGPAGEDPGLVGRLTRVYQFQMGPK